MTNSKPLKSVNILDLKTGMVVHFYGARFEILSTKIVTDGYPHDDEPVMCAKGKWMDGAIEQGYFGPTKDWNFQGNSRVTHCVEIN